MPEMGPHVKTNISECHDFRKACRFTESRNIKNGGYMVLHLILYICRASSPNRLVQSFKNLNQASNSFKGNRMESHRVNFKWIIRYRRKAKATATLMI